MFVWHIKAEVKYCISNFWVVSTNQNAKKYLSKNNNKFNKKILGYCLVEKET